jgi:hypothetical protein
MPELWVGLYEINKMREKNKAIRRDSSSSEFGNTRFKTASRTASTLKQTDEREIRKIGLRCVR